MPQRVYGDEQLQSAVHYLQGEKRRLLNHLHFCFSRTLSPRPSSACEGMLGMRCVWKQLHVLVWIHISKSLAFHLPLETTCVSLSLQCNGCDCISVMGAF